MQLTIHKNISVFTDINFLRKKLYFFVKKYTIFDCINFFYIFFYFQNTTYTIIYLLYYCKIDL